MRLSGGRLHRRLAQTRVLLAILPLSSLRLRPLLGFQRVLQLAGGLAASGPANASAGVCAPNSFASNALWSISDRYERRRWGPFTARSSLRLLYSFGGSNVSSADHKSHLLRFLHALNRSKRGSAMRAKMRGRGEDQERCAIMSSTGRDGRAT